MIVCGWTDDFVSKRLVEKEVSWESKEITLLDVLSNLSKPRAHSALCFPIGKGGIVTTRLPSEILLVIH